jgi:hypothetical protein
MAVQRLAAAYRSRPRPSSTPGAKASTVSPYYLDGERPVRLSVRVIIKYPESVVTTDSSFLALYSFQGPPRRARRIHPAGRSLKTEQRSRRHIAIGEPGRRSREISLERR